MNDDLNERAVENIIYEQINLLLIYESFDRNNVRNKRVNNRL